MAEVYTFLECEIKRVGSAGGDSTEAFVDAYAEGVDVTLTRDFTSLMGDGGTVVTRIPSSTRSRMTISKLYDASEFLFDGNDIKLYMGNALGTEEWLFEDAYWTSKGWSGKGDNPITYNVAVEGNGFTLQ